VLTTYTPSLSDLCQDGAWCDAYGVGASAYRVPERLIGGWLRVGVRGLAR